MITHDPDPATALAEHMRDCRGADAAIVMQSGSADPVIASMLADGWTWTNGTEAASTERMNGKRIRYLTPPPGGATVADLGAAARP